MRFKSWTKRKELESIGLACIWHSQQKRDIKSLKTIINGRCNHTERQNLFSKMSEKISLVFYQEMKHKWGREECIKYCSRNERNGLVWMKAGV
jgi:hypothetical protein